MRSGVLRTLTLAALVLVATATVASAQVPIRSRGATAKVSGQTLTIASRDNSTVEVRLADNAGVTAVVPAALSDIKAGALVGARPRAAPVRATTRGTSRRAAP